MENYGGFWLRFAAYLIDTILLYIVTIPVFMILGVGGSMATGGDPAGEALFSGALVVTNLVYLVATWLYFALMESSAKQGTLGKMALGLIVTDLNGNRIGFGRATGRYFGKILSGLILLIGYIMAGFTEKKQGLHDMLAGTLVLRGKPGETGVDPNVFS